MAFNNDILRISQLIADEIEGAIITGGQIFGAAVNGITMTASEIYGTLIEGATIIGGTFKTAASGERLEMNTTANGSQVSFYTGEFDETGPGAIRVNYSVDGGSGDDLYYVAIAPPAIQGSAAPTHNLLIMNKSTAFGNKTEVQSVANKVSIYGDEVQMYGDTRANGSPIVTGGLIRRDYYAPGPSGPVFNTGAYQTIYQITGVAVPGNARTAYVTARARGRSTINAAGQWKLQVFNAEDYQRTNNNSDQYQDMGAHMSALVSVVGYASLDLYIFGSADSGGGGVFTAIGGFTVSFYA